MNFEAAQRTFITDRGPPKPISYNPYSNSAKSIGGPLTFDGIFPKQVISSVGHTCLDVGEHCQALSPWRLLGQRLFGLAILEVLAGRVPTMPSEPMRGNDAT